jgi:hypothetical protein
VVEPLVDRRARRPAPLVQPGSQPTTCHVCGHQLEPDDIFCNECGAVRPAVTAAFTGPVVPLPIARPDWAAGETSTDEPDSDDDTAADAAAAAYSDTDDSDTDGQVDLVVGHDDGPDDEIEPAPESADAPDADLVSAGSVPPMPGSPTLPSSAPLPEDSAAHPPTAAPLPPVPGMTAPVLPLPVAESVPSSTDADESSQLDEDVDETRIVTKTPTRAPFVLHFSTGERLGVHGTGLLGRLPRPQPGERFDDLLTIHDPGKSVSKTHLEFGRDGDDLWVSDRFSGNGSVIRHIDGSIRRCEPGRRYRVERGARVDVGEQFFLVQ